MFSFFLKQKTAFGLDLSESSLRALQLEPLGKGFFPSAFCEASVPAGLIADDKILNSQKLAAFLRATLQQPTVGQIENPYVVISIPESRSFVRVITVPKMTEEEAADAVPFEAEQYIPLAPEQVYLDFKMVPSMASSEGSEKMRVLICASPRELVDSYVEVAKLAGLKPVAVEVESEAIARSLVSSQAVNEPILILDISASRTNLIIFDLGALQFTSSLPIGGNILTVHLAQTLTVTAEEAEKMKRQVGLLSGKDGGRVQSVLEPLLANLLEAIDNTINFYKEHSEGGRKITRVLLCGGGSRLKGFTDFLSRKLQARVLKFPSLTVQIGDPWVNVLEHPIKKVPPISKVDSVSFATVIGLALRGREMG